MSDAIRIYHHLTPELALELALKLQENARKVQEAQANGNAGAYTYVGVETKGECQFRIRIGEGG